MDSSSSRSRFEQKGSLMKSTLGSHSKQQELTLIDSCMLFNLLLRSIQQKQKNSFIIYDFSEKDSQHAFHGDNVINAWQYPDFCQALLQGPPDKIKLADLQKLLPKDKQELFAKRMRYYNFIVMIGSSNSQFFGLFQSAVNAIANEHNIDQIICQDLTGTTSSSSSRFWDGLLSSGMIKTNDKELNQKIEHIIINNPEIADSQAALSWKLSAALQTALKANKINEVLFYKQSSEHFFLKYPFFKTYLSELTQTTSLTYPNEVFCGRFFFGNWKHAQSKEVFEHIGITHVVNVTQEVENYFENSTELAVKYLRVAIEDVDEADISKYFSTAYNFLFEALQKPNNIVLVHCAQGKSRSATIVILFFMRLFGWNYSAALKFISDRRDVACPNQGFDELLNTFERNGYLFNEEIVKDNENSDNNDLKLIIDQVEEDITTKISGKLSASLKAEILREIQDTNAEPVHKQREQNINENNIADRLENIELVKQEQTEYQNKSIFLSDPPFILNK